MKYMLANIGGNLVSLACIGVAGYLASNDKNGWGWFLFLGLLCSGSATLYSGSAAFQSHEDDHEHKERRR